MQRGNKHSKEALEQRIDKLCSTLRDISNRLLTPETEWKERQEAMQEVLNLVNSDYSDMPYFPSVFERIAPQISTQFSDMRTGIVKLAAQIITDACVVLGEQMTGFGERILSAEGLMKQLSCGNKIIAEIAHDCRTE